MLTCVYVHMCVQEVVTLVTMSDLVKLAIDIAKGCHYLEDNHFIHR